MKTDLPIDILGTSFSISAEEDPAHLESVLTHYRLAVSTIQRSSGLRDPLKIAILTGFLLCDEVQRVHKRDASVQEAGQIALDLIARIDDALPDAVTEPAPAADPVITESRRESVPRLFTLHNPVKHYAWGSSTLIPTLLGQANPSGEPWAELWMGVHPRGPSLVEPADRGEPGEPRIELTDLIAQDPAYYAGPGRTLPFLFKLIAVESPLSIQAHPNAAQAQDGWDREADLPLNAPNRNYQDPNPKPELICALTPFTALAGFRPPDEIVRGLSLILPVFPAIQALIRPLQTGPVEERLRQFLQTLFLLSPDRCEALTGCIRRQAPVLAKRGNGPVWTLCASLAHQYPGDPGVIAPLYLNLVTLDPGEALFLPPGVLHAYIHGFGLELMSNSDNVLRAGLTTKRIDPAELLRIVLSDPFTPQVILPQEGRYAAPLPGFVLTVAERTDAAAPPTPVTVSGPAIALAIRGTATLSCSPRACDDTASLDNTVPQNTQVCTLPQGAACFIPYAVTSDPQHSTPLTLTGAATVFIAGAPAPG